MAPISCEFSKTSFNTRMPHVWSSVCLPVQITSISSVKRQETLSGARRSSNLCPTLPRIFCKFSIFSFAASMLSITFACSVPSTGSRSHCIPGALLLGGNIGHWVYMQWDLDPVEGTKQAKVIDSMEAANEKIENLQNILGRVGHRLEERLAPLRVSCRFTDDIEVICTGRQTDDHTCGIRVLKEVFENSHEIGAIDQSHTPVAYTYYQQLHQAGDDTQRLKEALYNDLWGFDTGAIASGAAASQNARVESADADLEEAIRLSALAAQEREDADFARRLAQENPFGVLEMSTPDTSSDEALARLLAADFNYA